MPTPRSKIQSQPEVRIYEAPSRPSSSGSGTSSSDQLLVRTISQDHGRPRKGSFPNLLAPHGSSSDAHTSSLSTVSMNSSVLRFRDDFEELKCKMRIFGESLNLCRCIASDFKSKMTFMEKRLQNLERRQQLGRTESNYSAIIQKNLKRSSKIVNDAKLPLQ